MSQLRCRRSIKGGKSSVRECLLAFSPPSRLVSPRFRFFREFFSRALLSGRLKQATSRANQALRSLANAGFQIEGFVCKRFLPSPPPPPTFIFWLLFHFSRGQNRESRSSVFLCSETKRKRLLRRLCRSVPLRRVQTLWTLSLD